MRTSMAYSELTITKESVIITIAWQRLKGRKRVEIFIMQTRKVPSVL